MNQYELERTTFPDGWSYWYDSEANTWWTTFDGRLQYPVVLLWPWSSEKRYIKHARKQAWYWHKIRNRLAERERRFRSETL